MKDIFLVDLDETLIDFPRGERENLRRTLRALGAEADERVTARFHAVNDSLWKRLERGELTRERLKSLRFELLFKEEGWAIDPLEAGKMYYENFPNICYPYAGANEFIHTLAARGRVYAVTNGGAAIQRRHIALAGFAPCFSDVFISEEVGADKPSPAFAAHVRERVPRFDRSRAVWLGDSLTSDCLCARELGVDFVLFAPRGAPAAYGGAFVRSYAEFVEWLDADGR